MKTISINPKVIAISDLRRRFGEIEAALPYVDEFILTKKGRPFAVLTAAPIIKRRFMKKMAGVFRNTELADEELWKDVLKRKSRKKTINL